MVETFGNDPDKVGVLLEFLTVLPEEVNMNHRIPIEVSRGLTWERKRLKLNLI